MFRICRLALCLTLLSADANAVEYVLPVSEDTSPYSFVPTINRYNADTLYAFVTHDDQNTQHAFETYLRFPDLAGVIPSDEIVVSAELLFFYAFDFTGFGETSTEPADVYCHEVKQAWDQTTLSWLNRPAVAASATGAALGITSFGLQTCDVTPVVYSWAEGTTTDNGLALISNTARVLGMHSSEASVSPVFKATLVINTATVTHVPSFTPGGIACLLLAMSSVGAFAARRQAKQ